MYTQFDAQSTAGQKFSYHNQDSTVMSDELRGKVLALLFLNRDITNSAKCDYKVCGTTFTEQNGYTNRCNHIEALHRHKVDWQLNVTAPP